MSMASIQHSNGGKSGHCVSLKERRVHAISIKSEVQQSGVRRTPSINMEQKIVMYLMKCNLASNSSTILFWYKYQTINVQIF